MSSRNQDSEFSAGNKPFAAFLVLLIATFVGIWLTVHPKSPLKPYKEIRILFEEVGTLRAESSFQVLGVEKGKVHSIELLDEGVLVVVHIDKNLQLAADTKFRVVNTGLLGQREIEVRPGNSNEPIDLTKTLKGTYDHGSTRLVYVANSLFYSLDSLLETSLMVWDSTLGNPQIHERISILHHNAKQSVRSLEVNAKSWKDSLSLLEKDVKQIQSQFSNLTDSISSQSKTLDSDLTTIQDNLKKLQNRSENLFSSIETITKQLDSSAQGSASLLIFDQKLHSKTQKTLEELQKVLQDVRVKGLDMNADIF